MARWKMISSRSLKQLFRSGEEAQRKKEKLEHPEIMVVVEWFLPLHLIIQNHAVGCIFGCKGPYTARRASRVVLYRCCEQSANLPSGATLTTLPS